MTFALYFTIAVAVSALIARVPAWHRSPWTRPLTIAVGSGAVMLICHGTPLNAWYNAATHAPSMIAPDTIWPASLPELVGSIARLFMFSAIVAHSLFALRLARYLRWVTHATAGGVFALIATYALSDSTNAVRLDVGALWEPMTYHWLTLAGFHVVAVALLLWATFVSLDGAKPCERAVLLLWFAAAAFAAAGFAVRVSDVLDPHVTTFSGGVWPITVTATLLYSAGVLMLAAQACRLNRILKRPKGADHGMGRTTAVR
ncbi:membrane protein [Gordonia phage Banquo]|nr:membrane protein [Gordonia phage Banquo]